MNASQNMATPTRPCKNGGTTINAECFHVVIEIHKSNIYVHVLLLGFRPVKIIKEKRQCCNEIYWTKGSSPILIGLNQ
jgi:hypothetical protein